MLFIIPHAKYVSKVMLFNELNMKGGYLQRVLGIALPFEKSVK